VTKFFADVTLKDQTAGSEMQGNSQIEQSYSRVPHDHGAISRQIVDDDWSGKAASSANVSLPLGQGLRDREYMNLSGIQNEYD
jgi:hypothetical protein